MRTLVLGLLAVACIGCATVEPYKVTGSSAKDLSAAFDCALGVATSMNYTPEQVNKASGFFKAEHNYRPGFTSIRWGASMTDELSVLITSPGDQTTIQVTGASGANAGRNLRLVESSSEVVAAAKKITEDCK